MKHNQFLRIFVIALVAAVVGATSLSSAQETVATNTGELTVAEAPSGEGQSRALPQAPLRQTTAGISSWLHISDSVDVRNCWRTRPGSPRLCDPR